MISTNFAISDILQGVIVFLFVDKDAQAIASAFSTVTRDANNSANPNQLTIIKLFDKSVKEFEGSLSYKFHCAAARL